MIYVTLGTDKIWGFERLVEGCDQLAETLSEPVVMQIGVTQYKPKHADYFDYAPIADYATYFDKAKLIISHCSIGPIVNAIKYEKPLIVFPRRGHLKEVADDHQYDFAQTIKEKNIPHIKVALETEELSGLVRELLDSSGASCEVSSGLNSIVSEIRGFVANCANEKVSQ